MLMKSPFHVFVLTYVLCAIWGQGKASPPANDDFADRIPLSGAPTSGLSNTREATFETGIFDAKQSVWWSWIAPETRAYTIEGVSVDQGFSSSVGVFTGTDLPSLVEIASTKENILPYIARVVISAVAGVEYSMRVGTESGLGGNAELRIQPGSPPEANITHPTYNNTFFVDTPITLQVDASDSDGTISKVDFYIDFNIIHTDTEPPYEVDVMYSNVAYRRFRAEATDNDGKVSTSEEVRFLVTQPTPPNDDFADRTHLTGTPINISDNIRYATTEPGDPTNRNRSLWYSWTAPESGAYVITTRALPGFFTSFLGIYEGSDLSGLTTAGTDTSSGYSYSAQVLVNTIGGTAYSIGVGLITGIGGEFSLSIVPQPAPDTPATIGEITTTPDGFIEFEFLSDRSSTWALEKSDGLGGWAADELLYPPGGIFTIREPITSEPSRQFFRLRAISP